MTLIAETEWSLPPFAISHLTMPAHLQASLQSALFARSTAEAATTDFRAAHLALLETLGYSCDKTHAIPEAGPDDTLPFVLVLLDAVTHHKLTPCSKRKTP